MDYADKEYNISKIICGYEVCELREETIFVYEPSYLDRIKAYKIYKEAVAIAAELESLSDEEMVKYMMSVGLWDKLRQTELDGIPMKLEALKIEYYNSYLLFQKREHIKKVIERTKTKFVELSHELDKFKHNTIEGYATAAKNRYLVCMGARFPSGEKVWNDITFHLESEKVVDDLLSQYYGNRVGDELIRELSKTEPWRSIWSAGKMQGSIFDGSAAGLSSAQKALICWSKIYDSIRESSDCPPDEVIDDNDMIDGWLLVQNREHAAERIRKITGGDKNDKFGKADETFIMVQNPEDVARIESLNVGDAKIRKAQRMAALTAAGGKMREQDMPDSQMRLREQAHQQMLQKIRGA